MNKKTLILISCSILSIYCSATSAIADNLVRSSVNNVNLILAEGSDASDNSNNQPIPTQSTPQPSKEQCLKGIAACQQTCEIFRNRGDDAWIGCRTHCGNAGDCN